jgi:hypothetical protein
MSKKFTGYQLSRDWWDFAFQNPDKVKPNHTAIYFFAIEHYNRLGQKEKFGFPTTMTMEATGIKSYNTYIKALNDLFDWGALKCIERSKNQYSANIIAISNFDKAPDKALDKAFIKHGTKHCRSTQQSIDSIDKQRTINKEQLTDIPPFDIFLDYAKTKKPNINKAELKLKYESWVVNDWKDGKDNKIKNWKSKLLNTLPYISEDKPKQRYNGVL